MAKDARQYARISVDLPANMKLAGATPGAKWLSVVAVLWATQNLTDGEVTPAVMTALAGVPAKASKELMERGVWHSRGHCCPDCPQPTVRGNVRIHHYLLHQDDAHTIRESREKKAEAGRRGNHEKWGHPHPFEGCPRCNR